MLRSGVQLAASRVAEKHSNRSSSGRMPGIPNYEWDEELDNRLQSEWLAGGVRLAVRVIQEIRSAWSRDAIQRRARKLGLMPRRRPWSLDDLNLLLHSIGGRSSIASLAALLKRSENSVRSKLRQLNYSIDDFDGYRPKDLANRLGVSVRQVRYWVESGLLSTLHHRITEESFVGLLRTRPELVPVDGLPPETREWLRSLGYAATRILLGA
jgi:hypothetical protein